MRPSELRRLGRAIDEHYEKAREMARRIEEAGDDGDERAARVWEALYENLDWCSTDVAGIVDRALKDEGC